MTDRKSHWSPDKEEAVKRLIRQTIESAGNVDPATLPHRVKQRLKDQATGDLDVDAYIRELLRERRR